MLHSLLMYFYWRGPSIKLNTTISMKCFSFWPNSLFDSRRICCPYSCKTGPKFLSWSFLHIYLMLALGESISENGTYFKYLWLILCSMSSRFMYLEYTKRLMGFLTFFWKSQARSYLPKMPMFSLKTSDSILKIKPVTIRLLAEHRIKQ